MGTGLRRAVVAALHVAAERAAARAARVRRRRAAEVDQLERRARARAMHQQDVLRLDVTGKNRGGNRAIANNKQITKTIAVQCYAPKRFSFRDCCCYVRVHDVDLGAAEERERLEDLPREQPREVQRHAQEA